MNKFTLNDFYEALNKVEVSPDQIDAAAKVLEQIAEENKPDPADRQKRSKKEIVGYVADNLGPVADQAEQQIWLVQVKEGIDHCTVESILTNASKEYNESVSGKKKKNKIAKFAEIFSVLKPKFLSNKGVKILTKEPIVLKVFKND